MKRPVSFFFETHLTVFIKFNMLIFCFQNIMYAKNINFQLIRVSQTNIDDVVFYGISYPMETCVINGDCGFDCFYV